MLRLDDLPDELKALMARMPEPAPAQQQAAPPPRPFGPKASSTMLMRKAFGTVNSETDDTRTGAKSHDVKDLPPEK